MHHFYIELPSNSRYNLIKDSDLILEGAEAVP
jgi:hypothetical protein